MLNNISRYITARYLSRMNAKHVSQYPQLVGYFFDTITSAIHIDGRFERDELSLLSTNVFPKLNNEGDCLDIGANIGNHSLAFSPFFKNVISLEPHPITFRLLEINTELVNNVTAYNVGASNMRSSLKVAINKLNQGATSIEVVTTVDTPTVTFNLVPIDELDELDPIRPISFIKIDVEGHEVEAILGAENTIRKHSPVVAIEVLSNNIENGTSAAVELLRDFGYNNFYEMRERGWIGRLSRRPKKLVRSLITLLTGVRLSKAAELAEVISLEKRSYPMLLCTTELKLEP